MIGEKEREDVVEEEAADVVVEEAENIPGSAAVKVVEPMEPVDPRMARPRPSPGSKVSLWGTRSIIGIRVQVWPLHSSGLVSTLVRKRSRRQHRRHLPWKAPFASRRQASSRQQDNLER